ncbi:MAG: hypothetical protein H0V09_08590 [Gemmatimonadetes bacterium]|nr:hypothetical protein [Gemmatimonadota bacterium]
MDDAPRVSVDELARRMEAAEDVTPVDVRRASYEKSDSRIRGAIRVEPDDVLQGSGLDALPSGGSLVTYCT